MAESIGISLALSRYIQTLNPLESSVSEKCREFTEAAFPDEAWFMISREESRFLSFLVSTRPVRKVLEIGTFTGYSAIMFADALNRKGQQGIGEGNFGRVDTLEINERYANVARQFIREAGFSSLVSVHVGDAKSWLVDRCSRVSEDHYDLIFIDADKSGYLEYFQIANQLLSSGGMIVVDNVLWGGKVADISNQHPDTVAIRQFNDYIRRNCSDYCFATIGDGLLLYCKTDLYLANGGCDVKGI
jgi:O-methyltransferase